MYRLFLVVIAAAFALAGPATAQTPEEDAASAVLDAMHAAESAADGQTLFSLFTEDASYLGTDVSERWSIEAFEAYAAPYFEQGRGWTYTPLERNLTLAPHPCRCVVWFDEVLDNAAYGTARGTGVIILTEGGWRIGQYALTFPIPNALAAELTQRIRAATETDAD